MKKQIALGLAALGTAAAMLPLFAAFEAHVINVTARIENALQVPLNHLDFGTVFPQEHLFQRLPVALSRSFLTEDRVDDVEYIIRQKPKCGVTTNNGTVLVGPTATGHVIVNPQTGDWTIDCGPDPREKDEAGNVLPPGSTWGVLPDLCRYISKEGEDENDEDTLSFHWPWQIVQGPHGWTLAWLDTKGRLAKSENDEVDNWTIDLAVPCFGGYCAQDWADHVRGINQNAGDPNQWTQPIENEHKVFGCDLWLEVTEVSEKPDFNSCGVVQADASGAFPISGTMLNPADYSYTVPTGDSTAGNAADHKWVHLPSPSSTVVWDMGIPTKAVTLVPSIDHPPIPAEAKEATLHGSDFVTGPWETGVETATYNAGPSSWISDDYTTRWVFSKPYKYVRATVGGTLLNDGDAEIDAVCSAK